MQYSLLEKGEKEAALFFSSLFYLKGKYKNFNTF